LNVAYAASSEVSGPRRPFGLGNVKVVIAGGVIVLAVAYLVIMGLQNSAVYFLTVSELQAKGPAAQNQLVRVSGNLVPGSLQPDPSGVGLHFAIADPGSVPLAVVYRGGQVPDIMGDNIEIVAEGKLDSRGTFVASSVLAKCPSRLENAPPEEHSYGQTA
jgi:cytochrome c-type biogenesis protein CcmE